MQVYSIKNIILLVNGVEITGLADGEDVVNWKRRVDSASDKVGNSGEMMVSLSADTSGEFTVKLQQTSGSNSFLQSLVDAQELAKTVPGSFVPTSVRGQDLARQDLGAGSFGYIKKYAEVQRGAQGATQEWGFVVENLDQTFGPNVQLGS